MAIRLRPLSEQVIVITGASSGIGLATARAAAAQGAKLVLAARNDEALSALEAEINSTGGLATHVVADVGRREDVQRIADAAIHRFGGFDTWVNDAGVSIYGFLEEVSDEDHQRLFQTNFWGTVYGSLIAASHLKGRGGAIINVGSVVSDQAIPLQGMYSASKHAIKGFTDALRMELLNQKADVAVTLIKPASINTPFTEHAKKYTANQPELPAPVYRPEEVARAILHAATKPTRDIFVGSAARAMSAFGHAAPRAMDRVASGYYVRAQQRQAPAHDTEGALHRSGDGGRVSGSHRGYVMKRSFYTRAATAPTWATTAALVAVAGVTTAAILSRRRTPKDGYEI
jgi:short-subunit dehydrogenase